MIVHVADHERGTGGVGAVRRAYQGRAIAVALAEWLHLRQLGDAAAFSGRAFREMVNTAALWKESGPPHQLLLCRCTHHIKSDASRGMTLNVEQLRAAAETTNRLVIKPVVVDRKAMLEQVRSGACKEGWPRMLMEATELSVDEFMVGQQQPEVSSTDGERSLCFIS